MKFLVLATVCLAQAFASSDWLFPVVDPEVELMKDGAADKTLVDVAKELKLTKLIYFLEFAGLAETIATGGKSDLTGF